MPYKQRIAFLTSLLLLTLGYFYAYVPAHYLADDVQPYAELDEIDFDTAFEYEIEVLEDAYAEYDAEDYTASALDALAGD